VQGGDVAQAQPSGRRRGFVYASPPRPGEDDWTVIVAESFVALIASEAERHSVEALAQLTSEAETPLERVIEAIPVGDGGVESFAVVHFDAEITDGWQVTAIARGRAVVDVYSVGGARRFSSSGVQPWLIATFRDVVALDLGGPTSRFDAIPHRPHDAAAFVQGTIRASSILWSVAERAAERVGEDASPHGPAAFRGSADLDDDTVRLVRGEPRESGRGGAHAARVAPAPGFDEETVQRAPGRHGPVGPERGPATQPPSRAAGSAGLRRASQDPPSQGQLQPFSASGGDRYEPDERTVARAEALRFYSDVRAAVDGEDTGRRNSSATDAGPRAASGTIEPAPAAHAAAHAAADEADDVADVAVGGRDSDAPDRVLVGVRGGERVELDAPVVFGRRPASTRRTGVPSVLVTVPSPGQEVSASHVRIERAGRVVVVTDLKSRNGTTVRIEGGRARRLRPGESFSVPGAAEVEIGDGTIIDITPVWWVA
jgi:hypothetical protein